MHRILGSFLLQVPLVIDELGLVEVFEESRRLKEDL